MKNEKISYLVIAENEIGQTLIWGFEDIEEVSDKVNEIKSSNFWKNGKVTITKKVVIEEVLESIVV